MRFIVFEGLDGSGKSTLIRGLEGQLSLVQQKFISTREPGGTPLAEDIRSLILAHREDAPVGRAELLLYLASRAQHVETLIRPSLLRGEWVLCDRFTASSVAFQGGGRDIHRDQVRWLNDFATHELRPDLTVLIDVPVELSQRRQKQRSQQQCQDRIEAQPLSFHEKVRDSFLAQARENANSWLVLDGNQSSEDLLKCLWQQLQDLKWVVC